MEDENKKYQVKVKIIIAVVLTMLITENYIVPGDYRIFGILLGLFVCFNHRTNIKRLLKGTESKIF